MNQIPLTINDFWKDKNSKREKWTETNQEVWLVENGEKIKLIGKNHNTYKELIREGEKESDPS
ncbi:hypothetical protein [endosymbiont GvMRE of Glomus versiforme]|uniref:hypothetical protein n=1 Tax=endosymbiont GvMRE of Glomus versiforme TaxID=2039283 RepID=UPI000EEBDF38|nr:hypothetical protein [endosymbiont GvMRE of Glomus versiforme]RHZ37304.1 hypothetical protein GvMRE_I1g416 [endosymbiont GvMRE of Glomus versiforme]